jgi:hypothetical protein
MDGIHDSCITGFKRPQMDLHANVFLVLSGSSIASLCFVCHSNYVMKSVLVSLKVKMSEIREEASEMILSHSKRFVGGKSFSCFSSECGADSDLQYLNICSVINQVRVERGI